MNENKEEPRRRGSESESDTVVAGAAASNNSRQSSRLPFVAEWRNAVRDCRELSVHAKSVLFVLSTYMSANADNAYPSYATIAAGASVSRRTAIRAVKEAESLGFLAVERRDRKRSVYTGLVLSQSPASDSHDTTPSDWADTLKRKYESAPKGASEIEQASDSADTSSEPGGSAIFTDSTSHHYDGELESVHSASDSHDTSLVTGDVYILPDGVVTTALTAWRVSKTDEDVYRVRADDGGLAKMKWNGDNQLYRALREAAEIGYPVTLTIQGGWIQEVQQEGVHE